MMRVRFPLSAPALAIITRLKMKSRLWIATVRWWHIRRLKRYWIEHLALRRKAFKDGRLGFLAVFHHERCYRDIQREVFKEKLKNVRHLSENNFTVL